MGNRRNNANRDKVTNAEIIDRLDVRAEYEDMGVQFTSRQPSNKGWLSCRAHGTDDKNPSAGVKIAPGGLGSIGDYKEFNDAGRYFSFFQACAEFRPDKWPTWQDARDHFRNKVGLPGFRQSAATIGLMGKGGFDQDAKKTRKPHKMTEQKAVGGYKANFQPSPMIPRRLQMRCEVEYVVTVAAPSLAGVV